jgi:DNA-binding CsgD family transcriptional regulator
MQQGYSFLSKPLSRMVYHRAKPVWINDQLRYFICSVVCSVEKETGNPRVYYKCGLSYEEYSFKTERWKHVKTERLTERERAILMLARQGRSSRELADTLYASYHTVRNQIGSLFLKLGVNSMLEAVVFAANRRMIFGQKQDKKKFGQLPVEPTCNRARVLFTADMLQRIQQALDNGLSIRKAARQEGIAEFAIRYWIRLGRLKK